MLFMLLDVKVVNWLSVAVLHGSGLSTYAVKLTIVLYVPNNELESVDETVHEPS